MGKNLEEKAALEPVKADIRGSARRAEKKDKKRNLDRIGAQEKISEESMSIKGSEGGLCVDCNIE